MSRLIKDYVDIPDHMSLDGLIERLVQLREALPEGHEAELKVRGDDIFGRHLSIAFLRPQTAEEAECEARYANACSESLEAELSRLQEELGYCALPRRKAA